MIDLKKSLGLFFTEQPSQISDHTILTNHKRGKNREKTREEEEIAKLKVFLKKT